MAQMLIMDRQINHKERKNEEHLAPCPTSWAGAMSKAVAREECERGSTDGSQARHRTLCV